MAFPFAEPADPARYYAQGLAIGERIKENAAAQDRNKMLDTFNQSMARIALGMKVEDQAFQRVNTLEDNQRQRLSQEIEFMKALPDKEMGASSGDWGGPRGTQWIPGPDPNAGIRDATTRRIQSQLSGRINAPAAQPGMIAVPEGSGSLFPVQPGPEDILPSSNGPVNQLPLVAEAPPPGVTDVAVTPTSPTVANPITEETAVEVAAVPEGPSPWWNPVAAAEPRLRAYIESISPEARTIYGAQDRAREAQAKYDAAFAAQNQTIQDSAEMVDSLTSQGGKPDDAFRLKRSLIQKIADDKEAKAGTENTLAQRDLQSLRDARVKEVAADTDSNFRRRRARQIIASTLATQGINAGHPVIQGWENDFAPVDRSQQDNFLGKLQEKIKTTGETERLLNGPLFDPIKIAEPQFDGPLRIDSEPLKAKEAMTKVLQTKAAMDTAYEAAHPAPVMRDGVLKKRDPDPADAARYARAKAGYEAALSDLQTKVNVLPKPVAPAASAAPQTVESLTREVNAIQRRHMKPIPGRPGEMEFRFDNADEAERVRYNALATQLQNMRTAPVTPAAGTSLTRDQLADRIYEIERSHIKNGIISFGPGEQALKTEYEAKKKMINEMYSNPGRTAADILKQIRGQ